MSPETIPELVEGQDTRRTSPEPVEGTSAQDLPTAIPECNEPARPSKTRGQHALNICGAIGITWVAVYAIWGDRFGITTPGLKQFAGIIGLLVMLLIGVLIGAALDGQLKDPKHSG